MINKEKKQTCPVGYSSPRWSGEILDCSMPMTFDQYGACSANCLYCFSYYQKILKLYNPTMHRNTEDYQKEQVKSVNPKSIQDLFDGRESQFKEYIKRRIPMQWGGLADPFDINEKKYGVGLCVLKILKEKKYPVCFSTKFGWWLEDDRYTDLFEGATYWNTKFSIINLDSNKAKMIEQGLPSPEKRLQFIKQYCQMETGGATLRLRPFIIGLSDYNEEYLDLITQASKNGATAVSTEFFCLEGRGDFRVKERYAQMSEVIGFDIHDFYRKNSPRQSGYLRLNWKIKKPYIDKMKELCDKLDMRFYVSDAHHKDKCANGSCCGLDSTWNYQRGQFTEMLVLAKTRNDEKVYWSDMEEHIKGLFDFKWRQANSYNTEGSKQRCIRWNQTMYDYIHEIWNSPNNAKSPYKYFQGLLKPVGLDKNSNVIYQYTQYEEDVYDESNR